MAKGQMYVKDFDFSVQPCNYSYGGSAKAGQDVQMAKSKAVEKSMAGQKMTKMASGGYYAKGGMKEPESRMVKAPAISPKSPMRRAMPVAPAAPMIQPGAMKKGGFVPAGSGMVKTEGTLGIKGNKNPGEMNGKPTMATKTGNVPYKKGGGVKKYADGGIAGQPTNMAGRPIPGDVMSRYASAQAAPQGPLTRMTLADGRSAVGQRQVVDPKFAAQMKSMGMEIGSLPAGAREEAVSSPPAQPQRSMPQRGQSMGTPPQRLAAMKAQAMRGARRGSMPMQSMGGQMPPQGSPQMDGQTNMMKTGGKAGKKK